MTLPLLLLLAACGGAHQYPDDRGLVGQLEREVIALQQHNRSLERQVATCSTGGPPDAVYRDMKQIFNETELELSHEGAATTLVLPSELLFSGELRIRAESSKVFDMLGMVLSSFPKHRVLVEGHVAKRDLTPKERKAYGDAWGLSYAMARAAQRELTYKHNVAPYRFSLTAQGSLHPRVSNDTPSGRARNERVVVHILPPLPE